MLFPYQGDESCNVVNSMNNYVTKLLQNNSKIEVTFRSSKLSSGFNLKDKIDLEHNHDLIYHTKCPEPTFIDDYVGESARQIAEKIKGHDDRDHTSHISKHSIKIYIKMLTP